VRRLLVSGIVLAVGLAGAGAGGAAVINGTEGADHLLGTRASDVMTGRGGNDVIDALAGNDTVVAGDGVDRVNGGAGGDRIATSTDGSTDSITCGAGRDLVNADLADRVGADCEVIGRQLSRDPYTNPDGQHATQVEPDSFSFGTTIVTAFQSGRFHSGGASNIGFATSTDAGASWKSGFLPGLSILSTPAGTRDVVSDPVVAYDARHGYWLIASLGRTPDATELVISRSRDGLTWSTPTVAARDPQDTIDKEWLTCDNWASSGLRGRCYMSYLVGDPGQIVTQGSSDAGLTWSAPVAPPGPAAAGIVNGAQPVVQKSGNLVLVFASFFGAAVVDDQISSTRSLDGGATFEPVRRVSALLTEDIAGFRAPPLPSAEVDKAGRVYVAWSDCRFRSECSANDIVLSKSLDGLTWTAPVAVPTGSTAKNPDFWVPGLGVDVTTAGSTARLALAFHSSPFNCGYFAACAGVDVGLVTSSDGGRTWGTPQRLNVQTMRADWLANTGIGRMTGDYISTSFVGGQPVPVFSLAAEPPFVDRFRQAIFATTIRVAPAARR
jgi:hemolysin type calcium-binding protein